MEQQNLEKNEGTLTNRKPVIIVVSILVVLAVCVTAFMVIQSKPVEKRAFSRNTYVNGVDVSGLGLDNARLVVDPSSNDVEFTVTHSDSSLVVLGSSFGYKEKLAEDLQTVLEKQTLSHKAANYFKVEEYNIGIKTEYDPEKLRQVSENFTSQLAQGATPCQNATIKKDETSFIIVDEVLGDEIDADLLYAKMDSSILNGTTKIVLDGEDVYKKPQVTRKEIEESGVVDELNEIINLEIGLDFLFTNEMITSEQLSEWLDIDENANPTLNQDAVYNYVASLAAKYDTLGRQRTFSTSRGRTVSVSGGIYGWQMSVQKTTDMLVKSILEKKAGVQEPVYITYGFDRGDGNDDITNTFIEVSLTEQTMWYYKNGELILETPVVTGLAGTDRETPTGVFSVWLKEKNRYLTGEDYKLWVDYWLQVDWTGVGLHDASWQASFGGDRYLTHGSHGCVNTPYDMISLLYSTVELGTPVVIYKA